MPADWKILLRVLCFHERQNNRVAIVVTACAGRGASRVRGELAVADYFTYWKKRGKITPSQMNLNIGILLSAVSGKAANCSAVWYVHKHPSVCSSRRGCSAGLSRQPAAPARAPLCAGRLPAGRLRGLPGGF